MHTRYVNNRCGYCKQISDFLGSYMLSLLGEMCRTLNFFSFLLK